MTTVYCPVIESPINGDNCCLICDVADRMVKPAVLYDVPPILPEGIRWDETMRNKCLNCQYHDDGG